MKATSKFARLYGRTFYKDGKLRKTNDIPKSYLKRLRDSSIASLRSVNSWEDY